MNICHNFCFFYIQQLCSDGSYEPMVFLSKAHSIHAQIAFGDMETLKGCPKNKSRINFNFKADVSSGTHQLYNDPKEIYSSEPVCPREFLKFDPPARNQHCTQDVLPHLTDVNKFNLSVSFRNVSKNRSKLFRAIFFFNFSLFAPVLF